MNEPTTYTENSVEQISLVVDHYNRYPGELACFTIRFIVPEGPGVGLQIAMPQSMKVESYQLPPDIPASIPSLSEIDQNLAINIPLDEHFVSGQSYEIGVQTRIDTFYINHYLIFEARLIDGDAHTLGAETIQVAIFGKGKYLQYLPDIYEGDDFTSRFLMLFESFWKPISQQIDQVEYYFGPDLTPPEFIPWLASWLGLRADPLLPVDRVRRLLKNAMLLFQCRGTNQALKTYLEIYTSGEVGIIEHQAKNFVIGQDTALGMGIALGTDNRPNLISISLRVPESELTRTHYSEDMYNRKMAEIVRTLVPAHTFFNVDCEFYALQN